ncbi:hypothetical protein HPB50_015333 [Hyalomma asiaticum]|uniref:Uncharacterized protein n=1 Tax=Hyalomma asiaticum TaxID=266040 RepID=A0ACB7SUT0_HYAAI|nr:hypothetical protein HPB50_015333 [Hyalomma asiaticum]
MVTTSFVELHLNCFSRGAWYDNLGHVLLCCLLAIAASAPVEEYPPQPYSFSYDTTDEFGTRLTREETGDANNNKVGSYSYTDATGITRTVKYTADAEGFHVTVETNEPGTKSSNPADALYTSNAVEVAPAPAAAVVAKPVVAAVKPVVVQAAPAPVAVHAVHAVQPAQYTVHAAPIAYATAHHVAPLSVVHPVAVTIGKAKA